MHIYENAAAEFAQEWAVDVNEEIGSEIVNLKMIQASSFDPKSLSPFELLRNISLKLKLISPKNVILIRS